MNGVFTIRNRQAWRLCTRAWTRKPRLRSRRQPRRSSVKTHRRQDSTNSNSRRSSTVPARGGFAATPFFFVTKITTSPSLEMPTFLDRSPSDIYVSYLYVRYLHTLAAEGQRRVPGAVDPRRSRSAWL